MSGLTLGLMSLDQVDIEVGAWASDSACQKQTHISCPMYAPCGPAPPHLTALAPAPAPQILRRSGTERQKRLAQRIQPVLRRPHVLLVTLLVCNACAAEALPLVLDRLANPLAAVVLSVTVVLFFGG